MITKKANAKLNLGLEVTGKRDDGYHDLVSVMQLVDLHDTLTFEEDDDGEIRVDCALSFQSLGRLTNLEVPRKVLCKERFSDVLQELLFIHGCIPTGSVAPDQLLATT